MSTTQVRAVVFTLNSPTSPIAWPDYVRYGVYQLEKGAQGTPHYQGYAELTKPVRFSTLKKWLPTAHFEPRRGTREQARDYCMKEESREDGPWEHGSWEAGGQGKRNDIISAVDTLKEQIGKSRPLQCVAEEHPVTFVKFHRGLEALMNQLVPPRTQPPEVVVFYGATGTGKSRAARAFLGEQRPAMWVPSKGHWFDGYCGQEVFLFEEFRGQLPMPMMLSLLDRYTAEVQVKGGMRDFVAKKIAITSPKHPELWYPSKHDDDIKQLMRRITRVERLGPECDDHSLDVVEIIS